MQMQTPTLRGRGRGTPCPHRTTVHSVTDVSVTGLTGTGNVSEAVYSQSASVGVVSRAPNCQPLSCRNAHAACSSSRPVDCMKASRASCCSVFNLAVLPGVAVSDVAAGSTGYRSLAGRLFREANGE